MINEVREFIITDKDGNLGCVPNEDDIKQCILYARANNCIAKMKWFVQYSGWYDRLIYKHDYVDLVLEKLPKMYGL